MKQVSKNNSTLLFVILTGSLVVVSFISYNKILQFNKSVDLEMHTNGIKNKILEVVLNLKDAEIGQRGYLLTDDSVFLQSYKGAEKSSNLVLATLDSLISDNPQQVDNFKKLKKLVDERFFLLDTNLLILKKNYSTPLADSALSKGKVKMESIGKQVALMLQTEDKILVGRTHVKDRTAAITPIFLLLLSLFSILVITLFFFRLQKETTLRVSAQKIIEVEAEARKKIEESEAKFRDLILQAPVLIGTIKSSSFNIETINKKALEIWGKSYEQVVNKPLFELSPEWESGLKEILHDVYTSGKSFFADEMQIQLKRPGKADTAYFNLVFQPLRDLNKNIYGIIVIGAEITEQVLAKKQIEASEEKFRTLSESIPHMVWTATPDGNKNFVNQYFLDYTGLSLEDLKGVGMRSIIFPDDLEKDLKIWSHSLRTGEDFNMEKRLRRHDGTYRWHISHGIAQKDMNGHIIGWIGSSTEIEEQKRFTEQLEIKVKERTAELEERKNFVETILETSKEYIAVYAIDFTLIDLNKAAENLMGKKRADLVGKKLLEILPNAKGTKAETDLQSAFNGNSIHNAPYQSRVTGRYIENYITPLRDNHGNVYGALAIGNDVTNIALNQKEIESVNKQLQLQNQTFELAESIAKFGSYRWNMTTSVLEYSDSLFRLLDCEPEEFVPSFEKFLSFVHPDDLQQVIQNGEQTMQTGVLVETPYRIISKTGTVKYLRSSGKFLGEGANRILIGTVQDISNDVAASKELKAKNVELENANNELASFSYVASHDLQEPLRKIQMFSKRIADNDGERLSDTTKDYFKRILSATERMQYLIESLLSFSRTIPKEVVFEKTDLNETLLEVQSVLNELIIQKNAVIESQTLPVLNAVPVQMHQLFLNLIGNSLKYSKPGVAPHIKISAEKVTINEIVEEVTQKTIFWKIVISDNGIGFEQQYEPKIFELFQRLHGKTEYEGTGIGLAICKKIVQLHKGTISATAQLNVGATFTFFLSVNN